MPTEYNAVAGGKTIGANWYTEHRKPTPVGGLEHFVRCRACGRESESPHTLLHDPDCEHAEPWQ